ncbi:hypothetical protein GDO81_021212 [Engystomops pustulosus]|uniref:Nudix hydrolase domain-containing protein n=1 Tax=Engystomops pustulosus TaxID=76066 RepID=A0AAV6ZD69_ENGPU|nr:hypothetical protein GDO81_021212 [Engystomops pustulosus]KAG8545220.1 hypothetical protein GDO81_021212 [Engystomops pustulosus]
MASAKRVLVYLSKEASLLQRATFVQGVTGFYGTENPDGVTVNCGLDHNRFIISDRPFNGSRKAELQRPAFCPIKNLSAEQAASLPEEISGRGVDVGVAILLESVNKRILLTRRSKGLHIFPNVWVPPGGHMEDGEELLDAGLRELQEETGISLRGANLPWSILGLWEVNMAPIADLCRIQGQRQSVWIILLGSAQELTPCYLTVGLPPITEPWTSHPPSHCHLPAGLLQ